LKPIGDGKVTVTIVLPIVHVILIFAIGIWGNAPGAVATPNAIVMITAWMESALMQSA